jgi:hypothetical protein
MAAGQSELKNLIDQAVQRASSLRTEASVAIGNATKLIADAGKELPKPPPVEQLPNEPTRITIPSAPIIERVDLDALPPIPSKPFVQSISAQFPVAPANPNIGVPSIVEPVKPGQTPQFNKQAPNPNLNFTLPNQPSAFGASPPTMVNVSIPTAPNISQPTFSGVKPIDLGNSPDVAAAMTGAWTSASASFQSAVASQVDSFITKISPQHASQMAALENKLAEFISGSTETGMLPAVENAIYSRSQSKQDAEARRVADEATTRAARMGFTMPSGALMGAMQKARQAGADNNAQSAREIVVLKHELQQRNMQFALSTSTQLRQTMVNAWLSYHGNLIQLNGQATQYATAVADSLVKSYQLAVSAFNARLDAYKADAAVYETLVKASLAEVEVFKAKVDAELARVQVNQAQVQVYRSMVDAHQSAVQAYKANVDAVATLANIEKLKVDIFESEVRAFVSTVEASKAEWQAYSAAWNGEETKVKAHLAQAQVYAAQVDGYKAHVYGEGQRLEATGDANRQVLSAYEAEVRAWAEQVRAHAVKVNARIDAQKSLIGAYEVNSRAAISQANIESERYRAMASVKQETARLNGQHLLETAKIRLGALDAASDNSLSAAQVLRGLAESTMAGINTLVTVKEEINAP